MPKRKIQVEAIIEGTITQETPKDHKEGTVIGGYFKHYKVRQTVEFEFKNPKNIGGEAWDWAQANWPDIYPEDHEFPLRGTDGKIMTKLQGKVRWACVTGVYNMQGRELPIADDHGKKEWKGKGKKKGTKRAATSPKKSTKKTQASPSTKGKSKAGKAKASDNILADAAAAAEDRTAEAVKKAMED
jgi:hypothetical protein